MQYREITLAADPLQKFWRQLKQQSPPSPVLYYQLGETYRDQAGQEAAKARGASAAGWTQSPHNYIPARAIDVYPIIATPDGPQVSEDPADYRQIVELAESMFLISGGSFGDYPHIELPNWRQFQPPKKKSLWCRFRRWLNGLDPAEV